MRWNEWAPQAYKRQISFKVEMNPLAASAANGAEKYVGSRTFGAVWAAGFCSSCLEINRMIKSAARAASPMTKMQGSPQTTAWHGRQAGGSSAGSHARSQLEHVVDLQAAGLEIAKQKQSTLRKRHCVSWNNIYPSYGIGISLQICRCR